MVVTEIREQRKVKDRYNIYVDGEYVFALFAQDVAYFKLKENCEISKKTFDYIQESLVYIKAQDTALYYIGYKMRTEKEVRKKLEEKEFSEAVSDKVIEFLKKYNYLNDLEYTKKYIKHRENSSPRSAYAIKYELKQRGITDKIIENSEIDDKVEEVEGALFWLNKKTKGKLPTDFKEKNKVIQFLQRKGYRYDIITQAFDRLNEELEAD